MITIFKSTDYGADCVTGERLVPGESYLNTGVDNFVTPYMNENSYRLIKESTIVWLAESAGYTLTRSNEGDLSDTKVVDGTDVSVGGAEISVGANSNRRRKAVK